MVPKKSHVAREGTSNLQRFSMEKELKQIGRSIAWNMPPNLGHQRGCDVLKKTHPGGLPHSDEVAGDEAHISVLQTHRGANKRVPKQPPEQQHRRCQGKKKIKTHEASSFFAISQYRRAECGRACGLDESLPRNLAAFTGVMRPDNGHDCKPWHEH